MPVSFPAHTLLRTIRVDSVDRFTAGASKPVVLVQAYTLTRSRRIPITPPFCAPSDRQLGEELPLAKPPPKLMFSMTMLPVKVVDAFMPKTRRWFSPQNSVVEATPSREVHWPGRPLQPPEIISVLLVP